MYQIELSVNVGVNHPWSFISLLLAFSSMQTASPTSILHMRKYPSLKNCYKYLLKSAIQKLTGQIHHRKSQKKNRNKSPKQNKSQEIQTKGEKKSLKKLGMDPKKIRKWQVKARTPSDVTALPTCKRGRWRCSLGRRLPHAAATSVLGYSSGGYKNVLCTWARWKHGAPPEACSVSATKSQRKHPLFKFGLAQWFEWMIKIKLSSEGKKQPVHLPLFAIFQG